MFETNVNTLYPELAGLEIDGLDAALFELESFELGSAGELTEVGLETFTIGHGMTEVGASFFAEGCCSCCIVCCCCIG